jgi:hypothetical protein
VGGSVKFSSLSTLLTFAEPLYHEPGVGSCNFQYNNGESSMMPSPQKRLISISREGKFHKLDESSSDLKSLKSNSLHEFAQLAGYL